MALGDCLQRCGQVAERLDVIELAGLDEGRDAGLGMGTLIMTGEQVVLASEGQRTDPVLDRVVVHLDMAIGEEHLQPAPAVGDVGELFSQT